MKSDARPETVSSQSRYSACLAGRVAILTTPVERQLLRWVSLLLHHHSGNCQMEKEQSESHATDGSENQTDTPLWVKFVVPIILLLSLYGWTTSGAILFTLMLWTVVIVSALASLLFSLLVVYGESSEEKIGGVIIVVIAPSFGRLSSAGNTTHTPPTTAQ